MSPEQAEAKPLDARSDVFSFGSVLYEMFTGKRAFQGQSQAALLSAVLRDDPKPLSAQRRDIPPELRRIVNRCLMKDRQARYPSAAELLADLKTCRDLLFPESGTIFTPGRIAREVKRPWVAVPLALLLISLLAAGVFWVQRSRNMRWAREVAVPQISSFYDQGKYAEAYALAEKAEKAIPDDRVLAKLWPLISYQVSIDSSPSGADVYRRAYGDLNAPWVQVGRTPLKDIRQPLGELVWKFEKPGFGTVFRMTSSLFGWFLRFPHQATGSVILDALDKIPPGMVRVSPAPVPKKLSIPGYEDSPELPLQDYWIDQFEVTNRQFKTFVDQGGYAKREYWKVDFRQDQKSLSWNSAMAQFRDAAGQPGPKNWLQGHYPEGQDDFPVTGVSWYEAAAYAEFSGKSLPTIYHWNRAAGPFSSAFIVPASNVGGNGVLPVGSKPGMSPWGSYDMAGNVEEWVWNEAGPGHRYLLGGAWDEPDYMFIEPEAQSPFLRASNVGFRCVKYIGAEAPSETATRLISQPTVDLRKLRPVSEEVFSAYRRLFSYDQVPLNPTVEHLDDNNDDWTTEKITYTAGYGHEQAISYLLLPKKFKPPFQTVIFFPGDGGIFFRSFSIPTTSSLDAILRSGRAVLHPIYKGTYERGDGTKGSGPYMTSDYRDHVIMWVKDASRAIDYAQTRADLDHDHFAYYGYSWGGGMGGIISAVDPRIKTSILALAGMTYQRSLPEVDVLNFLPRVKQPVLMLNGRYDFFCPLQSSQEPFFRLLGSRSDQKKHVLYDTSHNLPRNEFIKDSLLWLDQYLGPVQ